MKEYIWYSPELNTFYVQFITIYGLTVVQRQNDVQVIDVMHNYFWVLIGEL